MEPLPGNASTSLVHAPFRSRRNRGLAALITVLVQVAIFALMPAADARASAADTGTFGGVHIEKPGVHHHVHDSAECSFCITLQLGAAPAPPTRAPEAESAHRAVFVSDCPDSHSPVLFASRTARAPPACA